MLNKHHLFQHTLLDKGRKETAAWIWIEKIEYENSFFAKYTLDT